MKLTDKLKPIIVLMISAAALLPGSLSAQTVVTTNTWTAAFAAAAGVESPVPLAPGNMNHPPEYELSPGDLKRVNDADFLLYAGYEVMMKTVFDSLSLKPSGLIRIQTSYNPDDVSRALSIIAGEAGDPAKAALFLEEYRTIMDGAMMELNRKGLLGASVLVHYHQRPLAEALGFNIIGIFGPAPVKPGALQNYRRLEPKIIIDNGHNPIAGTIGEVTGVPTVSLRNFPGGVDHEGREVPISLDGVLRYNLDLLLSAMVR